MARTKMVDGVRIPLIPEEEAQRDDEEAAHAASISAAPPPDYIGFIHWLPTAFSTPEILSLNAAYVSFPWFCQYGNAAGIAYCITDALTTARITIAQYALFQQAVQTYHIPVVLP